MRSGGEWRLGAAAGEYLGMALVLGVLVAVFALNAEHFLTLTTFRTIANQIPTAVIIAVGMTFVLIVGGIDLSVGGVLALCSSVLGAAMANEMPLALAGAASLAVGCVCGVANGLVTVRWRIPSFIVTLGMMEIARGGAYMMTGSQTIYIGEKVEAIADASVIGLSVPFLLAFGLVATGQTILARTTFGRYMIAIGTSDEAARLSGINTRGVRLAVFTVSGLLCAVAAIINCSRMASADPNSGSGAELQAIAAVVIGGTSLMGGRGSVVASFFGVLIIALLGTGLAQAGADEPLKRLITGCVIVAAVILDQYRHRSRQ